MPDPISTPPAAPTDGGAGVNPSVPPAQPPVNPGQATSANPSDISGVIASYEQRISRLMSEKDKAVNERNQAISQLSDLQRVYTEEKAQTTNSLTNTANAAQSAIDQARVLEAQNQILQAELLRAKTLLAEPDLSLYEQFIPATSDPEKLQAAVNQLKAIRAQDLERQRAYGQSTGQQIPPAQGVPPTGTPGSNQQQPPTFPNNPLLNLYANRPSLAPQLIPGSTPAQMNPAGAGNPMDTIEQTLREALNSGDSAKYSAALEAAKVQVGPIINAQLGRT